MFLNLTKQCECGVPLWIDFFFSLQIANGLQCVEFTDKWHGSPERVALCGLTQVSLGRFYIQ